MKAALTLTLALFVIVLSIVLAPIYSLGLPSEAMPDSSEPAADTPGEPETDSRGVLFAGDGPAPPPNADADRPIA